MVGKWNVAEDNYLDRKNTVDNKKTGKRKFAKRPGWHIGLVPDGPWLKRFDGSVTGDTLTSGKGNGFQRVWAEVEYAADRDYNEEALASPTKALPGKIHSDGFYMFYEKEIPWVITGAIKGGRVMSEEERQKVLTDMGYDEQEAFRGYRVSKYKKAITENYKKVLDGNDVGQSLSNIAFSARMLDDLVGASWRTDKNGKWGRPASYAASEKADASRSRVLYQTDADREYDAVEGKYRGTDKWLKAPNGRPSNLNERQWVQVRTPSFKKWFGDWEKASIRKQFDSCQTVIISKGSFEKEEGETVRETAARLFSDTRTYKTKIGTVVIDKTSAMDSLAHGYGQKKLDVLNTLQKDFLNAVYLESATDLDGKPITNHFFAYPVEYEGQRQIVFCRVRQDVNMNRLYLHEVFVEEEIKSNALQTAAESKDPKPRRGVALYTNILKDYFSVNVSVVLDKNGEPLVMYHGTRESFDTFEKGDIGYHFGSKRAAEDRIPIKAKEDYEASVSVHQEDDGLWY